MVLGESIGGGQRIVNLDDLWKQARAWAESKGYKHNYANVQGVAPL